MESRLNMISVIFTGQHCLGIVSYSCGGYLYNASGIISAPEVLSGRQNALDCWWKIQTERNNKIDFQVLDFFLNSEQRKCAKATVGIWDDNTRSLTLCGYVDRAMRTQRTESHILRVNFRSDPGYTEASFRISYSVVEIHVRECGAVLTARTGWISSPDEDLDDNYDLNVNCWWNITAPPQNFIEFKFIRLKIHYHFRCYKDIVEVYDDDVRIFWYCDSYPETPSQNRTLSNVMRVHFVSDDANNDKGFIMTYIMIEAGTVDLGGTESPFTRAMIVENPNQVSSEDFVGTLTNTVADSTSKGSDSVSVSPVVLLITLHLIVW